MRRLMSRGTSYARPKHISLPQTTSYCVSSSALAQYKITIIFEFELNLDRVSLFLCFMRSDLLACPINNDNRTVVFLRYMICHF